MLFEGNLRNSQLSKRRTYLYCLVFGLLLFITTIFFFAFFMPQLLREPIPLQKKVVLNHRPEQVYVVFINGLGCEYRDNLCKDMGFSKIRDSLSRAGFSYNDDHFLLYSYKGGTVVQGRWCPNKYSARDTARPIYASINNLESMIEDFSRSHPEAKYILVGHSLGGRIAMDFVGATTDKNRERIKGVITLNSPLLGASTSVPEAVLHILDFRNQFIGSPAIQQLLLEFQYWQEFASQRRQTVHELQRSGVRVATFSTSQDKIVKAFTGCIMDERGRPLTDGFVVNIKNNSQFSLRNGHMQILEHQGVARYIVNLCSK